MKSYSQWLTKVCFLILMMMTAAPTNLAIRLCTMIAISELLCRFLTAGDITCLISEHLLANPLRRSSMQ